MSTRSKRDLSQARALYAEELRLASGSAPSAVEAAFARVPRETFAGTPPWRIRSPMSPGKTLETDEPRHLYHNVLVALDDNVFNGLPSLWYAQLEAVSPRPGERVLHVGAGAGYYSAILSTLVGPTGSVVAVEIDAKLGARARANLATYRNVELIVGDATAVRLPVDVIVVSAGVALVPRSWFEMLAPGGRILLPITDERGDGASFLFTSTAAGLAAGLLIPVSFSPCSGTRDADAEAAVRRAAQDVGRAPHVQSARIDPHASEGSCWLHTSTLCLSVEPPRPAVASEEWG